ncbi:MAG: peptidylprolyl isomerase [Ignavibacteriales bacterium]|nr:peptidylprolyl isomerase [Ignavibacteriales bacterium]
MKNSAKHLRSNNYYIIIIFAFAFTQYGCSKEEKPSKHVAKVNKSVLTEDDVKSALSEERNKGIYREEYINNWIQTEILFQEAANKGLLNDKEFKSLLDRTKKELASALFIRKIVDENKIEPTDDEIKKYFDNNKDDFKLVDDAYRFNEIKFNDYNKAVEFRNSLLETEWNRALNQYRNDQSIIELQPQKLLLKYQIQPTTLLRVITTLGINEVSVVFETEPMKFTVVQLLEKIGKDLIPQLDIVKNEVKERLSIIKRNQYIKEYIDKLIADHNLEIERYSE